MQKRRREKRPRRVGWLLGGVVLSALAVPLAMLVFYTAPRLAPDAHVGKAQGFRQASAVLQSKCVDCHSSRGRRPFYAELPFVRDMLEEDVRQGKRALDFDSALYAPGAPQEIALAKLEVAMHDGSMPPLTYRLAHWNAGLSEGDVEAVQGWIRNERIAHYASADVHPTLRGNVLQPIPEVAEIPADKEQLGRKLFHDVRLSGDDSVSCASCHDLAKGGVDGLPVSVGIHKQKGGINAPTVLNAALAFRQFWDGRAATLEAQAAGPVENPVEMGAEWPKVIARLASLPEYVDAFAVTYGGEVTKERVLDAIASFERTLLTRDSPFDRYLRSNDQRHLSAAAWRGLGLFQRLGCTSCHAGALLGGLSYEKMGVAEDYFQMRGGAIEAADRGRHGVTNAPHDLHRFKVPTLRNVALTSPYFHDGSAQTLEDAVSTMARVQIGTVLAKEQVADLVAFLKALTARDLPTPG